jgi:hypothetical protein
LRDSHLLPAGVLRLLSDDGLKNPNPYLMSLGNVGQTSSQAKQYLLCHECEQRFNLNGETLVINQCYHEETRSFPLRDLLKTHEPILAGPQGGAYDASKISEIDIEKLVYFSASVMWRASLRQWRIQKETLPADSDRRGISGTTEAVPARHGTVSAERCVCRLGLDQRRAASHGRIS